MTRAQSPTQTEQHGRYQARPRCQAADPLVT